MCDSKIKGLIFGQAIGDALGLASEFMTKDEVDFYYPNGICSFEDIIEDRHRSRWKNGDWTDDTDQMLCILDSITANNAINLDDIAKRFVEWKQTNGMGIGQHTLNVLSIGDYVQNPFKVSEFFWNISRKQVAGNGGIMRTAILGCWNFSNWEQVKLNTENVCKLTHFDSRCVGSCVLITYVIHRSLTNQAVFKSNLLAISEEYDSRISEYIELAYQENLDLLQLGERDKMGYTLKTMCAALWSNNYATDYYSGLRAIIEQGGDADTNGAVSGALLGLKFGFGALPTNLLNSLIEKELLMGKVNAFIGSSDIS